MRSILILYIFILSSCSTQYILESSTNEVIPISISEDKSINQIIEPYKQGVDSLMNEVLCFSEKEIKKEKPEGALGNFVTDLCLEMYDSIADICVMNNGGLRSSIPAGKITRGDIYKLMPFENELVVLELNAEEVYELAEYIISRGGEPFSGFNIYSDEDSIGIEVDNGDIIHKNKFENVVISLPVCGIYSELTQGDMYKFKILTSDYLANGGDKMIFLKNKKQYKLGVKLRDVIINYCKIKKEISSDLDGRIQITR